jgi:tripartite-type tricarboxylate transporter receptor subunit TctC
VIDMNELLQRGLVKLMLCAVAFVLAQHAAAQEYPGKPIRFIAPIAAGGLTDTLTRVLGQRLSERVGQPVVVENRPGAGGIIGMDAVAKSAPDGYTIVMVYQGLASVNPILYKTPPYETLRDFVPIAQVATFPMILVVNASTPIRSVNDLVDQARAKPGSMNYGSAGNATTSHLVMELFKRKAGLDLVHVPYKGEAPALTELMGGRVSVVFNSLPSVLSHIQSGKVRALAIATKQRSKLVPDVPTITESGIPDLEVPGWYGVLAPAGTPRSVVDRLSREFNAIVSDPETRARLASQGIDLAATSSEAFGKWIRDETERWRKVVADAGITPD